MIDLDNPSALAPDVQGMLSHVRSLGPELLRAWDRSRTLELPVTGQHYEAVIVAGMGGSATAGDYFATLCAPTARVPVLVARGALPAFVCDRTLVVASSYSGNTSEVLDCYTEARRRGAPVLAITRGGELARRAEADSIPTALIDYESPPRAAVAHMLAPLLRLGSLLKLCDASDAVVERTAENCATYTGTMLAPEVPGAQNAAKQCARTLWGRTPVVLAAEHLAPAGIRFKNQLAENGKTLAAVELLPEAAHNFVVGLQTARTEAARLSVVILTSALYSAVTQRLVAELVSLFEHADIPAATVAIPGEHVLAQAWAATAFADFVSCYVGLLHGIDPTPIPEIERMRAVTAGQNG